MKFYLLILSCCLLFLLNQSCTKSKEPPRIEFDETVPIGLVPDTLYADSMNADTLSIIRNINLKVFNGTDEVKEIVIRFCDSSFASVKAVNGNDSLLDHIPVYEKKIRPQSIDPFSQYSKEQLSFVLYPKKTRFVKYCWDIYVQDSELRCSNHLKKSLIIRFR